MFSQSKTIFAILGLLSIKSMSAYELVKFSNETIGFFWNESYGNIYSKLSELADAGYVYILKESMEGRRKKIYAINGKGKQCLKAWLKKPTEEIIMRDELLLKLFVSEKGDLTEAKFAIEREIKEMTKATIVYNGLQQSIKNVNHNPVRKDIWLLTLDYGHNYAQTRLDWCQAALKKIIDLDRE